jgi:very-short-patch-repair endonuclease
VSASSPVDDRGVLRRLARDQWVRIHGTPRVTVLAGGDRARSLWSEWAEVAGIDAVLLEAEGDVEPVLREALALAAAKPARPIAVLVSPAALASWHRAGNDRVRALVTEGLLAVAEARPLQTVAGREHATRPATEDVLGGHSGSSSPHSARRVDARSAAEAALFEALEATPATAGRFELNGRLTVRFGSDAAEVDLLSRGDAIAVEIDGYHHFTDPDCYRRDRRKDLLLQTQGLLVIRLLADDVLRDPREAVTVVCQGLAYRRGGQR